MSYQRFVFESYAFDPSLGELILNYNLDNSVKFTERYKFDFEFVDYDHAALDRAFQMLFLIAGVSYFKTFIPPAIEVNGVHIDQDISKFLSKTYEKGLGEFWYVNHLDPHTLVTFPITSEQILNTLSIEEEGMLVGVGGGKDSLTSIELLRKQRSDISTWSLNHRQQLTPLVERIGLPHYFVEREWDPILEQLKLEGAYNGHVPISAIFACVGVVVAILAGKRDVVTSNESSANEPTLTYQGVDINHQYSKSLEFEKDFQYLLKYLFGDSIRYYSFLRPFSELRIAELFSNKIFDKYKDVFSSCNRAYVHGSDHMFWCGECPKCAFTFLALSPFIERSELETLWEGKNLLLDPKLEAVYRNLLGIDGDKPLDCVGEIKESRAAMRLAQEKYPELHKYQFDLPDDYDFRTFSDHCMPAEVFQKVLA